MKLLIALLFVVTNAFAVDICKFEETSEFTDAMEAQNIKPIRISKNHKNFTSVEKQLIYKTVIQQDWLRDSTLKDALKIFGDYHNGRVGSNAGEIEYYNTDGKQFILVHYWPGDNEYGAYYMLNKNGSHKLIAVIEDSWIACK